MWENMYLIKTYTCYTKAAKLLLLLSVRDVTHLLTDDGDCIYIAEKLFLVISYFTFLLFSGSIALKQELSFLLSTV